MQFGISMQAWVVFFQKHCANPYDACKCHEIEECLFLLKGTINQLKRFLGVCNLVFLIPISLCWSLINVLSSNRHFLVNWKSACFSFHTVELAIKQAVCALRLRCIVVASFSIWRWKQQNSADFDWTFRKS